MTRTMCIGDGVGAMRESQRGTYICNLAAKELDEDYSQATGAFSET